MADKKPSPARHMRNMAVTAGGTMGSRVLGLVRDMLVTAFFGTTSVAGAFILAFQIPNLFRRLLGEGALTAALMPVMANERKLGGDDQAFAFLNFVMRRIAPLLIGLSLVAIVASWAIGTHWTGLSETLGLAGLEKNGSDYALAAKLTAVCMPYMPLICIAALFTAALNMLGRFAVTALSAIWLNVAMIVALGVFGYYFGETPVERVYWLCGGALVGGLFQLLVPAYALRRAGWRFARRTPAPSDNAWSDLKYIFLPAVLGAGVQQINLFVTRFLAFSVEDSALTVYYLANRIVELPVGVFAVTVSTVIFPALAAHAAQGDDKGFAGDFAHGMRLILAVNIAACAGLIALAEPIVRLLFQHGKFTAADTAMTVPVLMIFALSMPLYGVVGLCARALSAKKDTRTQLRYALQNLGVNAVFAPLLGYWFKAPGLAVATLISVTIQALFLLRAVRRRDACIASERIVKPALQTVFASMLMGGFAYGAWRWIAHAVSDPKLSGILGLIVIIPVSAAFYFGLLRLMRFPEAEEMLAMVRRKLRL